VRIAGRRSFIITALALRAQVFDNALGRIDSERDLDQWSAAWSRRIRIADKAIDRYAEAATGNREYFLNKPYRIGGPRKNDVP